MNASGDSEVRLTEAQKKVANDNIRLYFKFISKLGLGSGRNDEDFAQEIYLAFHRAVVGWKEDLGKLSTYAYISMKRCLGSARKRSQMAELTMGECSPSWEECRARINGQWRRCTDVDKEDLWTEEIVEVLTRNLTGSRMRIANMLLEGLSPTEIAQELGISRERVRQCTNDIVRKANLTEEQKSIILGRLSRAKPRGSSLANLTTYSMGES